jgi:hypothetical protein
MGCDVFACRSRRRLLGNHDAVPTGFELPNGEQQPFLHIMYPGFEWTATGALP